MVVLYLLALLLVTLVPFLLLFALLSRIPFIKRGYAGKERLWKIFWIFYVGIFMVFDFIYSGLSGVLTRSLYTDLAFVSSIYSWAICGGIPVWRCAFNVNLKGWGYLARTIAIIPICFVFLSIPTLGMFLFDGY
jgi:hypothetical protein